MRSAPGPTSAATRSFISPAALLVKVMARIWNGEIFRSATRYAIRCVSRRVLPEPAPATTRTGPSGAVTASRWTGLSPSSNPDSGRSVAVTLVIRTDRTGVRPRVGWSGSRFRRDPQLGRRRVLEAAAGTGLVPERPQEPGAVLVQRDGERPAGVVELEREVGLPVGVERGRVGVRVAGEAAEALPVGVEQPDAVGRLDAFQEAARLLAGHLDE